MEGVKPSKADVVTGSKWGESSQNKFRILQNNRRKLEMIEIQTQELLHVRSRLHLYTESDQAEQINGSHL